LEKAHLEELDKAKRLFLRLMTHELQAPLSAIQSYLQLMLEGYLPPEKQHETLEKCLRRLEDEKKLISDLMELGRLQTIAPGEEKVPTQLDQVLEAVVSELQEQASHQQLTLTINLHGPIPPVEASPKLIKSLWENLIGNAIKYTPPGGQVTASLRLENDQVVGEVVDTGIGIPAEEQGRLFSEFFRARNAKALNLGGTGLGLVIVKRIIDGAGGSLQVESEASCGAKFTFRLPVSVAEQVESVSEKA
jgi:signal transduction histidine kinase